MTIEHLAKMIKDYNVHDLTRTGKTCEVQGCENKAKFYYTWEFPSYRDYFCSACKYRAEAIVLSGHD